MIRVQQRFPKADILHSICHRPLSPGLKGNSLRTSVQRNRRKTIYRVLSVVFVLIGMAHYFVAFMQGGVKDDAFLWKIDIALLWLLFGATWVALSRLWGELAETNAAPKQGPDPTS